MSQPGRIPGADGSSTLRQLPEVTAVHRNEGESSRREKFTSKYRRFVVGTLSHIRLIGRGVPSVSFYFLLVYNLLCLASPREKTPGSPMKDQESHTESHWLPRVLRLSSHQGKNKPPVRLLELSDCALCWTQRCI